MALRLWRGELPVAIGVCTPRPMIRVAALGTWALAPTAIVARGSNLLTRCEEIRLSGEAGGGFGGRYTGTA